MFVITTAQPLADASKLVLPKGSSHLEQATVILVFLNIFNYDYAKNFGIKYPDIETAINFSYEIPLKGKSLEKKAKKESLNLNNHFGWHGKHFSNYQELLDLKFSCTRNKFVWHGRRADLGP